MTWFKVGQQEVNITPGNLLILENAMEKMSFSCTCKNCSVKRIPNKTNNPKCIFFKIACKQYIESTIKVK